MRRWLSAVVLFVVAPAYGCNKPGHMVVAAEAYDILIKTNPKTVDKFLTVMKSHPQWSKFEKIAGTVPPEDHDRCAMA